LSRPIDYLPNPLLEDIVETRCIPIIGAGFSRNAEVAQGAEIPLWDGVGRYFANQMKEYLETNPLDAISAFCQEFSRAKAIEQLRRILFIDTSRPGSAHVSFAELPFDIIITTNFDFLLERAYDMVRKPYLPIVREEQLSISNIYYNSTSKLTQILKIHGDFNNPDRIVISEEDYDTFLERTPFMSADWCSSGAVKTLVDALINKVNTIIAWQQISYC
jgi:SIR2-like domain